MSDAPRQPATPAAQPAPLTSAALAAAASARPATSAATPDPAAWTVGRLLEWTRNYFESKQLDQPRLCAELLLAEALDCKKIELYTRFEQVPPPPQVTRFRELVKRAAANEPVAYLLGRREFFSLMFAVTPDVLIPRPETETLVERALGWLKTLPDETLDVLDVGTGSGCIAAAIARFEKRARVVAADVSATALAVARSNFEKLGVAERVTAVEADGLMAAGGACVRPLSSTASQHAHAEYSEGMPPLPHAHAAYSEGMPPGAGMQPSEDVTLTPILSHQARGRLTSMPPGFHLIVSNPPYIAEAAVAGLPSNVRDYEPRVALSCGDGLEMFRRIAADAPPALRPGGRVYVEFGMGQAEAVTAIFTGDGRAAGGGRFERVGLWRDLAGIERVLGFGLCV